MTMHPRHTPIPRWQAPYNNIVVAGFAVVGYVGFLSAGDEKNKYHKYRVICTKCMKEYIRCQASLVKAAKDGRFGCAECSRPLYRKTQKEQNTEEAIQWRKMCKEWKEFLFTMPVASLRWRDEQGRSFDSEKSKVMGWGLI